MKRFINVLFILTVVFTACQQENETVFYQETGLVMDYAGAGNCKFVIELDNGNRIQPYLYPEGFE
ncbi:MAG TPA: hypothetical protein VKA10_11030, partial [Prolixibacteraceae bacterium]|nr:hypothetical protein [Prolixibacteraceae bacterium]